MPNYRKLAIKNIINKFGREKEEGIDNVGTLSMPVFTL